MCLRERREILRKESYENFPCIDFSLIHSPTKGRISKWTMEKFLSLGELGHIILVCLFYTDLILIEWLCRWCFRLDDKHFFSASEIQHLFYSKENDWGYSNFIVWNVSFSTHGFVGNKRLYIYLPVQVRSIVYKYF